jgi:uncharacterized protein (DUF488 family)
LSTDARPLLTVGHSNHPIGHLLALLQRHAVETVADVRSRPYSRFAPQFRKEALAGALRDAGIGYLFLGLQLGGKPPRGEVAAARLDYATRIRAPAFQDGIAQLLAAVRRARVALLCRERDPLDCHRLHLICRYLAPQRLAIGHILPDGALEPQRATERRLLVRDVGRQPGLFDADPAALEQAYERWWYLSKA